MEQAEYAHFELFAGPDRPRPPDGGVDDGRHVGEEAGDGVKGPPARRHAFDAAPRPGLVGVVEVLDGEDQVDRDVLRRCDGNPRVVARRGTISLVRYFVLRRKAFDTT